MKKLSLVIPIYNESAHLEEFLMLIDKKSFQGVQKQLIFVDDCSTDASKDILESFNFVTEDVKIFGQERNQGKGAALRRGFIEADGEYIVVQDADFEYDPDDLNSLLAIMLQGKADIVFGSRFKKTVFQVHRTFHYLVNRFLTTLSNGMSGLYLTDMETCYKLFKAEIIQNIELESNRFGFEPEVTAKIACLNARVCEVGISYFPRNYLQGKKITWKDGVAALWHLLYFNFFARKKAFFKEGLPEKYRLGPGWL